MLAHLARAVVGEVRMTRSTTIVIGAMERFLAGDVNWRSAALRSSSGEVRALGERK